MRRMDGPSEVPGVTGGVGKVALLNQRGKGLANILMQAFLSEKRSKGRLEGVQEGILEGHVQ